MIPMVAWSCLRFSSQRFDWHVFAVRSRLTIMNARKKKAAPESGLLLDSIGRGGGIRTRDPLHPMQVRYQAALRPD